MVIKLKHLHIKTPDPQKTAKWWAENLGAKIVREAVNPTRYWLDLDGVRLNISTFIEGQTHPQRYGLEHLDIQTDDFNNLVDKLKTSGVNVLGDYTRGGQRVFFIETAEGVEIGVEAMKK